MGSIIQAPTIGMPPPMELALCASFGSVAQWCESFLAIATAHAAEAGRVELVFAPREGALHNRWAAAAAGRHDTVLLAVQLCADAAAFVAAIDWPAVYERYQQAVHSASEAFVARQDDLGDALVLDVRRAGVFASAPTMLPGASWRDPAAVREWAAELPTERELVVYCVYGHEVGRATALRLRALGLNARFLEGGIDAWQSAVPRCRTEVPHEVGHPRAPEDRSHRLPVADRALHRRGAGVPLCARRRRRSCRGRNRCHAI